MKATTRNWNVHELLHSTLRRSLSWEKNLEGLHELGCRRSAPQPALLNPVLGENLVNHPDHGRRRETGIVTGFAPHSTAGAEHWDNTVGTSTNCSAICDSSTTVRPARDGQEILGTSITCSAIGLSKDLIASISWSTICGTSRSKAMICTKGKT